MRPHVRFTALAFLIVALFFAWRSRSQEFFLLLAIALELYSLTELQLDWREKIQLRKWKALLARRNPSSIAGIVAQGGAFLCLLGFFISSSN